MFLSIRIYNARLLLSTVILLTVSHAIAQDIVVSSSENSLRQTYHLSDNTTAIPNDFRQTTHSSSTANSNSSASGTQIVNLIRSKFHPTGTTSGSTHLTITVDSDGRVVNVHTAEDTKLSREAIRAVKAVGHFPIDSSDPKYPTFTIILRGSN